MTIPDYETLMPTVLELAIPEQAVRDVVGKISDRLGLSPEEREQTIPSGGKTLIKSRVEWAVTYLVHAGLLSRPRRGHFVITDRGRTVLADPPPRIDQKFLMQFPEFVDFVTRKRSSDPGKVLSSDGSAEAPDGRTPEEQIGGAYELLESELKVELLSRIMDQSPSFFEGLIVKLLSSMGYGSDGTLAQAIGRSGDGGLDGVIHQDKLGLDVVYIQAKRYASSNAVGRPDLQSFIGALSGESAHKGVFVTTSRFSSGALEYLKTVQQRVITIDGDRLVELMIEHGVGVKPKQVFTLHRIDEDFFLEE